MGESQQQQQTKEKLYNVTVIVTSDTCHKDETKDASGAFVVTQLQQSTELFARVTKYVVPDDKATIVARLKESLRNEDPALIITIGGTGLSPRDVTPEATSSLYEKPCSGIVAALHMASLRYTPFAALSRLTAGIIHQTLIVNFPGSVKACEDCLNCLKGFIGHALEQVRFNAESYNATHKKIQQQQQQQEMPRLINPLVAKSPNGQAKANDKKVLKQRYHRFGPSINNPHQAQVRTTNITPNHILKPTSTLSDSPSIRLSIREVLESRIDPLSLDSNPKVCEPTSSTDLIEKIVGLSTKDTPTKLALTKSPRTGSIYPLIDHKKAFEIMSSLSYNLLGEQTDISLGNFEKAYKCIGNILAQDIKSKSVVPPYSVSTMDGYVLNIPQAVRNAISSIKTLPPVRIYENLDQFEKYQTDEKLAHTFFCYQVNTGGRLPTRNFAVIPFEKTNLCPNDVWFVTINEVKPGFYVRRAGSDLSSKDVIEKGTIIGAVELSMIIAMQHRDIKILKRPTIGLLSTGDELVNFFSAQDIGKDSVVDTNGPLLASLFRLEGYRVLSFGITNDDPEAISLDVSESIKKCEVLLITGGASMGTRDHVKDVIEQMGGTIHFGRVNIKPGKPASFTSILVDGKRRFIFSLPGNPVSAYVTSLVLVLPFLEHAIKSHFRAEVPMTLDCIGDRIDVKIDSLLDDKESYTFDGRFEFIRAKISKQQETSNSEKCSSYLATVSLRQQSSCMVSLMDCNCFIMIDPSLKGKKLTVGQVYPALKLHKKYETHR